MNKKSLIKEVAKRMETTNSIGLVLETTLDVIKESLLKKEEVKLNKFGTFKNVTKKSKSGFNFQTNKVITLPSNQTVKFVCYDDFKKKLNK